VYVVKIAKSWPMDKSKWDYNQIWKSFVIY